jgi:RNA polymerase sigma-70 factor (ECF subfamily)
LLLPDCRVRASYLSPLFLTSGFGDNRASVLPGHLALSRKGERGDPNLRKKAIELYDGLRTSLHGYLSCLGLEPQEAEDIIQETFLKLFQGLAGGMRDENLRSWVFRVAHNLTINLHKSNSKLLSSEVEEVASLLQSRIDARLNPEEIVLKKEQLTRLVSAVARLNPQQRQCLHLRAEGLRYREIAQVLGVSTQRVADVVQSSLSQLAGAL